MPGGVVLPTGVVTFVFTDIQGSTKLVQELGPERWTKVLHTHYALLRRAWTNHNGVEMGTEGDAFFVAFADAADAVAACLEGQLSLADHDWDDVAVKVRIGMHTGEASVVGEDYIGLAVHEAARVGASAHGGQVIVSQATADAVGERMPSGASWRDLGRHALKDINGPRTLLQLVHPRLAPAFPPPRTLSAIEHNVPTPPTPLVGRAEQLAEATRLLLDDARLVTLTGPGGIGKTRLALEIAYTLLAYQPGGVWFVPLSGVDDISGLLPAVAETLNVREQPGDDLGGALRRRLRGSKALLVLDNLEQILDGVDVVAALLADLPDLRVLATSRERLRLRGERVVAVPPLSLSVPGEEVQTSESAELFAQRARAVGEPVGEADLATVAEIVQGLAGVPLAIELAAARLPDLGLGGLHTATSKLLDVLTEGERDLPVRQQTLRATLTWSHDLLDDRQKAVFARLAVFAGGIAPDALAEVAGPGSEDEVDELVAKSLVQSDGGRLSMLEPIRQFAAERLDASGAGENCEVAHARWFSRLAEAADSELLGPAQSDWLRRLAEQHDNLDAAIRYGERQPGLALALVAALARYWYIRGHWSEGRRAMTRVLALGGDHHDRANALVGAGALAIAQGDLDAAEAFFGEVLAKSPENSLVNGRATNGLAEVRRLQGDLTTADALLAQVEAVVHLDQQLLASARINAGLVAFSRGDLAAAARQLDEAIGLHAAAGNTRGAALAQVNRGRIAHAMGERADARERYQAALGALSSLGEQAGQASALENLGMLLDEDDEVDDRTLPVLEQHLHLRRRLGDVSGEVRALWQLGKLEYDRERTADALSWFDLARPLAMSLSDTHLLASVESYRTLCLENQGRLADAASAAAESSRAFAAAGQTAPAEAMASTADRLRAEAAGTVAPAASD